MSGMLPDARLALRTPPRHPRRWNLAAALSRNRGRFGGDSPGSAGGAGRPDRRPRRWLVVAESALCLSLVAGTFLEIKNLLLLRAVPPGFAARSEVLTASLRLPIEVPVRLPSRRPVQVSMAAGARGAEAALLGRLVEQAARLPGVVSAAATSNLPTAEAKLIFFSVAGHPEAPGSTWPEALYVLVTPAYFATLGIAAPRGRPFRGLDSGAAPAVAIVNQAFAGQYFRGEEPLGRRIALAGSPVWREIVGVAADVRQDGLDSPAMPIIYLLFAPEAPAYPSGPAPATSLLVRGAAGRNAASLAAPLRRAVAAIDPGLVLVDVRTAAELLDHSLAGNRFELLMVALSAAAALLLSARGIYRAASWSAARRPWQIALHPGAGGGRRRAQQEVVREGVFLAFLGTLLGLGGLTFFRMGQLCMPPEGNLPWYDPALLTLASLLLLAIAALVSWLPAAGVASRDGAAQAGG